MLEKYKMDEKNNKKIKEIRTGYYIYMVWSVLVIITILALETYTKSLLYIIFAISSFTLISLLFFSMVLYRMWEDIIKAIEEIKNNKSKNE
jgi:predicted neutral ceramidase superfamily lipid hydrolase